MTNTVHNEAKYYEIRIEGHLGASRARALPGLGITLLPNGQTLISGRVADQSALFGILIRIRDWSIPLISVTRRELEKGRRRT